jgi:tripartite-type tricarboxylate transporter receptor subunit TctC
MRRLFLNVSLKFSLTLGVILSPVLLASVAQAQAWPTKPVRFVVPFPPGSGPDVAIRLISTKLAAKWGQSVVVDNRPGGSGVIGVNAALQSAADNHTFLFAQGSAVSIVPRTVKGFNFDYKRDVLPVALIAVVPMAVAVRTEDELKTIEDFIALAKANPDKVDVGNTGRTTIPHLSAEVLGLNAGVKLYPIFYQSSVAAVTALIGNQVRAVVDGYSLFQPMVQAGKIKVLGIMADQVYPGLESYPLIPIAVAGTSIMGWFGVYAKAGTDAAVITQANADLNQALMAPDVVARFRDLGTYVKPGTPQALDAFTLNEQKFWGEKLDKLGIKPE